MLSNEFVSTTTLHLSFFRCITAVEQIYGKFQMTGTIKKFFHSLTVQHVQGRMIW